MFNPDLPLDGSEAEAAEMRAQLNGLKDLIDAVPSGAQGPQGIQGPPGNDGAPGAQGPAGADGRSFNPRGEFDSMQTYNRLDLVSYSGLSFVCGEDGLVGTSPGMDPRWTQLQVSGGGDPFPYNGNPQINGTVFVQGELSLFTNDPGGSGEIGVRIGRDTLGGVQVPVIANRFNGSNVFSIKLDFGGVNDGMGTPTLQHGDLFGYDGMSGSLKPIRGITQNIDLGTGQTLQIISGLIVGVTGP